MGTIAWDGYTLGDTKAGQDFTIMGRVGVKGLGTAPRDTQMTPNAIGGDTRGASTSRSRLISADDVRCSDRAKVLGLLGTMAPISPEDERPLVLTGFLWGDPDDEASAVQAWVGPERADPRIDVSALGLNDWHIEALSWIASDPTFYSVEAQVFDLDTPSTDQLAEFTNLGNGATLSGHAWTATITAATAVHSPYVDLGNQRVTWAGLNLAAGQTLVIDRFRHSRIGSLGVDGYRSSHGTPDPDWPVLQPGENEFRFGTNTGTITAQLRARSTWSM